ncbi:hypothetical protein D3C73_964550 [compost metagenome]
MPFHSAKTEEIPYLSTKNSNRYASRKTDGHRLWYKLNKASQLEQPHENEHNSSQKTGNQQIFIPVLHNNREQNRDKSSGWPSNLES